MSMAITTRAARCPDSKRDDRWVFVKYPEPRPYKHVYWKLVLSYIILIEMLKHIVILVCLIKNK